MAGDDNATINHPFIGRAGMVIHTIRYVGISYTNGIYYNLRLQVTNNEGQAKDSYGDKPEQVITGLNNPV
jgi:hypothetical protein